jgi:hypothetical protein
MTFIGSALQRAVGGAALLAIAFVLTCLPVSAPSADPIESQGVPGYTAESEAKDPQEILVYGPMKVSRWLAETVVRAAEVTGVDPAYLMALADKESSLLPQSKASTSSAEGLFQFLEGTWLEVLRRYGAKHGYGETADAIKMVQGRPVVADDAERASILALRRDPYLSALMAGEMVNAHREILAGKAERDPSFSELYMAHFLGIHGASRFLELLEEKPTQSASRAFPQAARANRAIFAKPVKTKVAKGKGAKQAPVTLAEVRERFEGMIAHRVARYESVREDLGRVVASN